MALQTASTDYSELIERLDLPTKVKLLTGATAFTLWPEPSIGLGELRLYNGGELLIARGLGDIRATLPL